MLPQKLVDDGIVVKTTFDLVLDVRVLHFFVLLDDGFDLVNYALESPVRQVGCHLHVLPLDIEFRALDIREKVRHLAERGAMLGEAIEHLLRELTIDFVLLEDSDFLYGWADLGHDTLHKGLHLLLFQVSTEDLQLGTIVTLRHLH